MNLSERIDMLAELGKYIKGSSEELENAKQKAFEKNRWFTGEFVNLAITNIANEFLDRDKLIAWTKYYYLDDMVQPKTIGIVMAGNIPLVGFHDFLCAVITVVQLAYS